MKSEVEVLGEEQWEEQEDSMFPSPAPLPAKKKKVYEQKSFAIMKFNTIQEKPFFFGTRVTNIGIYGLLTQLTTLYKVSNWVRIIKKERKNFKKNVDIDLDFF